MLDENRMEALVVALGKPEDGVLQERERGDIGDPEIAEQVVAAVEELLEDGNGRAHSLAELGDARPIRLPLLLLVGNQVRRPLPELGEPLQKKLHLRAPYQSWLNHCRKPPPPARGPGARG